MCAATNENRNGQGPITDAQVAGVLRPFVRAARPLLGALSDADPLNLQARALRAAEPGAKVNWKLPGRLLDLLARSRVPGTAAWTAMDVHERSRFWVRRVGRLTSLVAAIPGFGGVVTRRLPVSGALGATAQGLVLTAVADEHDVHDEAEVVALLGAVMFRRDLSPQPRSALGESSNAQVDARAAELTGGLEKEKKPTLQRLGGAVWRRGMALVALESELNKRPHGGRISGWLSLLPIVGVAGKYIGEWSGLKRAATEGEKWLHARHGA
jgi:hypothetical protein